MDLESIGYCGVDCSVCPDRLSGVCPGCRQTVWKEGDECMPVKCCRDQGIPFCGRCPRFPCGDMKDFYEESDGHRRAYELMRNNCRAVFRSFREEDRAALGDFLVELCREDRRHLNWNWARFEWMYGHPYTDTAAFGSIGLWAAGERIVGAAIYDMYFGEAFCGVLPGYAELYPEVLDYAVRALKDENGLGVAICDDSADELAAARAAGFTQAGQTETLMRIDLASIPEAAPPEGLRLAQLDPEKDMRAMQWFFWRAFDHGEDRAEFEREDTVPPRPRLHADPRLSVAALDGTGEVVSYCCLWFREGVDYAYLEPLCTLPEWRGKGAARSVVYEALRRAAALGAKEALVLSDMPFYEKLGFEKLLHYGFWWKK